MHMIAFSLTCLTNATVPVPSGWKKCVDPTGSSEMLLFLSLANVNIYLYFFIQNAFVLTLMCHLLMGENMIGT
jgi:hypothetical protein